LWLVALEKEEWCSLLKTPTLEGQPMGPTGCFSMPCF